MELTETTPGWVGFDVCNLENKSCTGTKSLFVQDHPFFMVVTEEILEISRTSLKRNVYSYCLCFFSFLYWVSLPQMMQYHQVNGLNGVAHGFVGVQLFWSFIHCTAWWKSFVGPAGTYRQLGVPLPTSFGCPLTLIARALEIPDTALTDPTQSHFPQASRRSLLK